MREIPVPDGSIIHLLAQNALPGRSWPGCGTYRLTVSSLMPILRATSLHAGGIKLQHASFPRAQCHLQSRGYAGPHDRHAPQRRLVRAGSGYSMLVNRLGDLERAIMDVLWESRDPLTVRQVSGGLTERDLAHTTVMTVLDRLAKKGFARRERDGRAWHYRASATREAYVTELMLNALDQTGDRHAALARFARSVSDTEAAALRRALEALDQTGAREDGHSAVREDGQGQGRVREATRE
jgi:predicted transcriptional regulator